MAKIAILLSGFICLICTLNSFGQKSDFSGKWKLIEQKSITGTLYENGVSKKMLVNQNNDKIVIEKTTLSQSNTDAITNETFFFDGKPFETVTASKRMKIITMKWDDSKKRFIAVASLKNAIDKEKEDMKITDIWMINGEEKLILIRKSENYLNGEIWESKSVYEKE